MNKGILFVLGTAVISGFAIFTSKILVASIDPIVYTTLKNLFVAGVLTAILIANKSLRNQWKQLSRRDWWNLIAIGAIGGGIPFALFFTGLKLTSATDATLIHKTLFIWVALFAIPVLHERLRLIQMAGYVLVLWGVLWTSGYRFAGDTGELYIALATILWALENILAKKAVSHIPGIIVAWGRMTVGVGILAILLVIMGKAPLMADLHTNMLMPFLAASILLTGYVVTYYSSLKYIPVTVASAVLILATPITALLEYGILNKAISFSQWQSYGLLAIGLLCITGFFLHVHRHRQPVSTGQ
ncbi:hypothetical protein A3B56_03275 [Candidatus Roizmanbacteria bacterium RIFCSPLOWO2_01_FULL_45_11]|uniref:EamA domain-containing protein n=1 Tax=Candidatus Roizmanbacteria bacterium RIFCSPLOWO2_01_FULL_45_11 TaxID=1802070 RepID=A0A1F7JDC1_9BACT|nr:MAG: hypothetical protein A3B56_03275 [Candidatus Roizmanbacteria bacterium RIFCSPLOWO2_01_FULL_45_11]